jgi:cyclase
VIVIDTTISPAGGKELLEKIAEITDKPVRAVILTHGDMDHVGGLAAFPPGVEIIAHEKTRQGMQMAFASGHARFSAEHLPNRILAEPKLALEIAGVRLELLHWAPAHTAGDLVVYLPTEKVAFTGDIFTMDQFRPLIHREQGGSSAGWIASAKGVAALDADWFVVGHGNVQQRDALQKRILDAESEREKIKELAAEGLPLAQIQAAVGDPPPGWSMPGPGGPRFTPFSEVVFQEFTAKAETK